ncbi:MAG: rod shape-determining protein MreC [Deltaproteobacteria bacterium]|nr:rod shape-determining protein MreC [Candidatus Zymogenaceae bacterium]
MLSFLRRNKGALAGAVIFVSSILLIGYPTMDGAVAKWGRQAMLGLFSPIQGIVSSAADKIRDVWDQYIFLRDMKEENEDLRRLVGEISTKYDNLKTLYIETEKKNKRLEEILGFSERAPYTLMPARVIGRDPSILSSTIVIDKGSADGVAANMPVISPNGIVGLVLAVSRNSSRVMLINDKNSRIDVLIQENREIGILEGSTDGSVRLSYIDSKVPVRTGNLVVTAGVGDNFPKGLPVGEVVEVTRPVSELFQVIVVNPKTDLGNLEEVLLIVR